MLPSDFHVSIGKTKGYNKKILVSNTGMKIGSTREINKDYKKLLPSDAAKIVIQYDNPKMLTEKHNDKKIPITFLIVGAELIGFHFW